MSQPCECQPAAFPFFCPRHQCEKTEHFVHLCQSREDYRTAWDNDLGPLQVDGLRCGHRSTPEDCPFCRASRTLTPSAFRGKTEIKVGGRAIKLTETEETCLWPGSIMVANRILVTRPAGTLVDIGCGAGLIGLAGLSVGCQVTFVDLDPAACQLAETNAKANGHEKFTIVNADWNKLEHEPFDNIYGAEVLWNEPEALLAWIDKHWTGKGVCCLSHSGRPISSKLFAAWGFDLAQTRADVKYRDEDCASAIYLLTRSKIRPDKLPKLDPALAATGHAVPPIEQPGPGTELKKLLESLGIAGDEGCGCDKMAANMNQWGVNGCRERSAEILEWMRSNKDRYGWAKRIEAAAKAAINGLAFKVNWLDPFPDLLAEAIRRAERS